MLWCGYAFAQASLYILEQDHIELVHTQIRLPAILVQGSFHTILPPAGFCRQSSAEAPSQPQPALLEAGVAALAWGLMGYTLLVAHAGCVLCDTVMPVCGGGGLWATRCWSHIPGAYFMCDIVLPVCGGGGGLMGYTLLGAHAGCVHCVCVCVCVCVCLCVCMCMWVCARRVHKYICVCACKSRWQTVKLLFFVCTHPPTTPLFAPAD